MNKIQVGLASVTFRKKQINEIVSLATKSGVECIEWGGDIHVKCIDDARVARDLCFDSNIKISSYGSYYRIGCKNIENWRNICNIACELSADTIRVWLGEKSSCETTTQEYNLLIEDAKVICDIAAEYNISVSAECHRNTYNDNTDSILKFKNDVNRHNFKTYFQSVYLNRNLDSDRIVRTKDFCNNVHVSFRDLKREQRHKRDDPEYIKFIIDELKTNGYTGAVLVEFTRWDSSKCFVSDVDLLKHYILESE